MGADRILIVKIGGMLLEQSRTIKDMAREIAKLRARYRIVVVHGGGHAVSDMSRLMGIKPYFEDGIRMTSAEEMPAVDMALCGLMNKRLARAMQVLGVPAVGIAGSDGGLVVGKSLSNPKTLRTGSVVRINPRILQTLFDADFLPIVASPAMDMHGEGLNINADEMAVAIGAELQAETLLFCADVPGILDRKQKPIEELSRAAIERQIESGNIRGGMIAKARACLLALEKGVNRTVIGQYSVHGDLERMLRGSRGTRVGGA